MHLAEVCFSLSVIADKRTSKLLATPPKKTVVRILLARILDLITLGFIAQVLLVRRALYIQLSRQPGNRESDSPSYQPNYLLSYPSCLSMCTAWRKHLGLSLVVYRVSVLLSAQSSAMLQEHDASQCLLVDVQTACTEVFWGSFLLSRSYQASQRRHICILASPESLNLSNK